MSGQGDGGQYGCGDGCKGGLTQFGGAVGRGGCTSVVVVNGVRMSVGGGGAVSRGSAVRSGGKGACAGSAGAS